MSSKNRKSTSKLQARIEAHPGTQMIRAFQTCEGARDAFEVAALHVRRLILTLEDPAGPANSPTPPSAEQLDEAFKEVLRRFLRFLGAADALVKRTEQVVQRDFISESHRQEHARAVNSCFTADSAASFMEDFQKFARLHSGPAMILARHAVPRLKPVELLLVADNMLHWGKWTPLARRYLHQFPLKLPVLQMLDGHMERTRTFFHRFVQRFREHHKADMEAAKALIEELHGPPSCPLPFFGFG